MGKIYLEVKDFQKSQDHFDKAAKALEPMISVLSFKNLIKIAVARAKVIRNEKNIELRSIFELAAENQTNLFDGRMSKYIAEILLNIDDQHTFEAENWAKKAIEADKRNGMMFYLGRDYAFYADLLK